MEGSYAVRSPRGHQSRDGSEAGRQVGNYDPNLMPCRRVGGGVWVVSQAALAMVLDGDVAALAPYHAGDHSSSRVNQYFERACPHRKSLLWCKPSLAHDKSGSTNRATRAATETHIVNLAPVRSHRRLCCFFAGTSNSSIRGKTSAR